VHEAEAFGHARVAVSDNPRIPHFTVLGKQPLQVRVRDVAVELCNEEFHAERIEEVVARSKRAKK
jgi:hypothetical protein